MTNPLAILIFAIFAPLSIAADLPVEETNFVAEETTLPTENIVGGQLATVNQFPSQAAILGPGGSIFCGGVIINAKTIMTAAHCSQDYRADQVTIRLGSLSAEQGGVTANISQLNTHPEYNATTYDNDISLWELATPVAETDASIKYAKLPNAGSDVAKNQVVRVSGWGANREGGFTLPEDLRWVDVRGVSRADCNTAYYKDGAKILDTMFCAAEDGKDSCQGDSGGPVMAADTKILVGIVSWGYGCARPEYPGVYTRLGALRSWIDKNIFL